MDARGAAPEAGECQLDSWAAEGWASAEALDPHKPQGGAYVLSAETQSFGNVLGACQANEADGEVLQASHGLRAILGSDLASVFIVRDIADPVEAVFYRPVQAQSFLNVLGGIVLKPIQAGDPIADFVTKGSAVRLEHRTFNAKREMGMREVEVAIKLIGNPQATLFNAAVALLHCLVLRGEKTSQRSRDLREESAGCL